MAWTTLLSASPEPESADQVRRVSSVCQEATLLRPLLGILRQTTGEATLPERLEMIEPIDIRCAQGLVYRLSGQAALVELFADT